MSTGAPRGERAALLLYLVLLLVGLALCLGVVLAASYPSCPQVGAAPACAGTGAEVAHWWMVGTAIGVLAVLVWAARRFRSVQRGPVDAVVALRAPGAGLLALVVLALVLGAALLT